MHMKLDIPKVKRESSANRSFSVMGPRLWNDMPNEMKQCIDVETFKKKLKTFFKNKVLNRSRFLGNFRDCEAHLKMLHQNCAISSDLFGFG